MTNGEKIKELYPRTPTGVRLDVDGTNGTMTFTTNKDWWNAEYREPTTKNDLGVDAISREQALNEFCIYNSYDSIGVDKVRSYLKALPSVTPQPRKGHWITRPHVYGVTYCSECDFELKIDNTNYCPNCGADMREVKE